jgi:hypothetical protein
MRAWHVGWVVLVSTVVLAEEPTFATGLKLDGQHCCDGFGVWRCPAFQAVGTQCMCPGQGFGVTCP